jgi:hypothetical protein
MGRSRVRTGTAFSFEKALVSVWSGGSPFSFGFYRDDRDRQDQRATPRFQPPISPDTAADRGYFGKIFLEGHPGRHDVLCFGQSSAVGRKGVFQRRVPVDCGFSVSFGHTCAPKLADRGEGAARLVSRGCKTRVPRWLSQRTRGTGTDALISVGNWARKGSTLSRSTNCPKSRERRGGLQVKKSILGNGLDQVPQPKYANP